MANEENERLTLIQSAMEGIYTTKQVATRLGISERAVRGLKRKYAAQGKNALVHGNSGRRPVNYIDDALRAHIASLKKSDAYSKISISRFRTLLAEREGIKISYSALLGILKASGMVVKKKTKGRPGLPGLREPSGR